MGLKKGVLKSIWWIRVSMYGSSMLDICPTWCFCRPITDNPCPSSILKSECSLRYFLLSLHTTIFFIKWKNLCSIREHSFWFFSKTKRLLLFLKILRSFSDLLVVLFIIFSFVRECEESFRVDLFCFVALQCNFSGLFSHLSPVLFFIYFFVNFYVVPFHEFSYCGAFVSPVAELLTKNILNNSSA